ncbi:uncharacterized protein LOC131675768 [Phymastichus coffea]|uniref:uncharacterized protein LOC131675768 n=1 Tax=Phymastichus coffea TaxID=108790 RepID=UPI00273BBE20|nr:uncharacterized protein LOC131675768 [Phymastichus coffea]
MKILIVFLALASLSSGDVSHILHEQSALTDDYEAAITTTTQGPPNPYSFQYSAGRFPGHVDRVQSEAGDGTGRVKGSFSYIDPKFKVRTIEYTVDENGFHPSLINYDDVFKQPKDSEAVRRAKERHRILYDKIAARNSQGIPVQLPKETASVERAKNRHFDLYQKIAAEHAAIAAERETKRLAFEATSVANDVNESEVYFQ